MIQFNAIKHFRNSHNVHMWSDWRPLPEKRAFFKNWNYFFSMRSIRLSTVYRTNTYRLLQSILTCGERFWFNNSGGACKMLFYSSWSEWSLVLISFTCWDINFLQVIIVWGTQIQKQDLCHHFYLSTCPHHQLSCACWRVIRVLGL